jgi:cyanate permease
MLTEQLLGVFAVWIVWTIASQFLEAPPWLWNTLAVVAGIAWEVALNPSWWWLGLGVGGGAAFVYLLADLVLLATDAAKVSVLRRTRTGP